MKNYNLPCCASAATIALPVNHTSSKEEIHSLISRKAEIVFNTYRGNGRHELGDLINESAIKVYNSLATFKPSKSPFDAWVYFIVRNTWFDMLRDEQKNPDTGSDDEIPEADVAGKRNHKPIFNTDIPQMEHEENVDFIYEVIKSLPNDYRKVIERHIEEWDNEEIAEEMGYTTGHVATLLFRARRRIRKELGIKI